MKSLAELSSNPGLLQTRKMSLNSQKPKRHNITLDGTQFPHEMTSPKNRQFPLLLADATRLERTNSIQNLVLTCKNAGKKHVRFEDEAPALEPQLVVKNGFKRSDCNLFSQIRDSKQHPPVAFEDIEYKIPQRSTRRDRSSSSANLPEPGAIEYRLDPGKKPAKQHIERLQSELETDSELLLKQSANSITKEDEREIRQQLGAVKQKALHQLVAEIKTPNPDFEELFGKLRKEVGREVDNIIDRTLDKRRSLYKQAQRQVKEYFLKIDSKKKGSPGSLKTEEGTPCFDERVNNYSFSKSGRRTHERNPHHNSKNAETNVSAFDVFSSNKQQNSIDRPQAIMALDSLDLSEKRDPKTQDRNNYCTNSSGCSKNSQSSRFTFTVSSRRKSQKTTKRIKDRIISGARPNSSGFAQEVVVKEFNV